MESNAGALNLGTLGTADAKADDTKADQTAASNLARGGDSDGDSQTAAAASGPGAGKDDAELKTALDEVKKAAAQTTPGSSGYRVGSLDVLSVTVFGVEDLSKTLQVTHAGNINYPLLGEVPVAGLTVSEIEAKLRNQLAADYLQDPQVAVDIKEFNSQRVTMVGDFQKQTVLKFTGRMTLVQAIAEVGGLNGTAKSTVVIFRNVNGKKTATNFDLSTIQTGKVEDPQLRPGDIVVANQSIAKAALAGVGEVMGFARMGRFFGVF